MRQLYSLLWAGLVLLAVACKKENAPALEGRWVKQRGTVSSYDGRHQLVSTTEVPGTFLVEITGQTIAYFRTDGVADGGPYPYTRQGNKVLFTGTRDYLTITTLTEHSLTLHYEGAYSPPAAGSTGGRTDIDVYYTR